MLGAAPGKAWCLGNLPSNILRMDGYDEDEDMGEIVSHPCHFCHLLTVSKDYCSQCHLPTSVCFFSLLKSPAAWPGRCQHG